MKPNSCPICTCGSKKFFRIPNDSKSVQCRQCNRIIKL